MKQIIWIAGSVAALIAGVSVGCGGDDDDGFKPHNTGGTQSGGTGGSAGSLSTGGSGGSLVGLDGGGAGDSGSPDGSCGQSAITATPRDVNILLIVDKSHSMLDKPPDFTTDKWTAMKSALQTALQGSQNTIDFGLELFPALDATTCQMPAAGTLNIPIEDGTTGVPKINALLGNPSTTPSGETPMAAALASALTYFTAGAGKTLKGDKYVLLATDGGPDCNATPPSTNPPCQAAQCTTNIDGKCPIPDGGNCCYNAATAESCLDTQHAIDNVTALASAKIPTFVVGIPGSENYATILNSLATAGGRPQSGTTKYYAVTTTGTVPGGLTQVLENITKTLITSCRLQLQTQPPDLGLLNVVIDGKTIPQLGTNGWDIDQSTSPPTIVLKGDTCTHIETVGAQQVQIIYGCPTITIE